VRSGERGDSRNEVRRGERGPRGLKGRQMRSGERGGSCNKFR
jgi:hypothetical protein